MKAQSAPLAPAVRRTAPGSSRRFRFDRIGTIAVGGLAVLLFVAALPVAYERYQLPCPSATVEACGFQLTAPAIEQLHAAGATTARHAAVILALQGLTALGHVLVAVLLVWRRGAHPFAWFTALFLVTTGAGSMAGAVHELAAAVPSLWLPIGAVAFVGDVTLVLFWFLFPDGRFAPRWTRWLTPVWIMVLAFNRFLPDSLLASGTWPAPAPVLMFSAVFGSGIVAQVVRYRRVSGPEARQQTKWVVFGLAATALTFIVAVVLAPVLPEQATAPGDVGYYLVNTVWYVGSLLIPLAIGIAVSRHRLWDLDPILNRTLVYGALTACVLGSYLVLVTVAAALVETPGSSGASVAATALVALLAVPLRARLQRTVDRLMYGRGGEPYGVLVELSRRLGGSIAPQEVLPTLVATVARALELPYAAIALAEGDRSRVVAAVGRPSGAAAALTLPLVHQGEHVGELTLEPRVVGEAFRPAEEGLLRTIAQHASVAAYAVRQTADLRRSRERLVVAREEERRRIRRDLHDGLGPVLGSLTLMLDAARNLVPHDPEGARELLAEAKEATQSAIADIRTLVYDLRPPVLDELGLLAAVREHAGRVAPGGPRVTVVAPEPLPPLPAAVELAMLRIVQEAVTNAVRHAGAATCTITIALETGLALVVCDDGAGIREDARHGVGIRSMRERAEELGGTFRICPRSGGGTCVTVHLPRDPEPVPHARAVEA